MRRILLAAGATAAALTLAACGSGSTGHDTSQQSGSTATTAKPAADHVGADVTFLHDRIPRDRGAIEMADLAPTRAQSPQVKELAVKIKSAQNPEITETSGWLYQWGEPLMLMDYSGYDTSHMAGMNPDALAKLTAAKGADFDRMFLTMMISHHQGAFGVAKTEQTDGRYQPAKDLAGRIITTQQAEITQMQNLLRAV